MWGQSTDSGSDAKPLHSNMTQMDVSTLAQYIKFKFAEKYCASDHEQANWIAEILEKQDLSGSLLLGCTAEDLKGNGFSSPKLRYLRSLMD